MKIVGRGLSVRLGATQALAGADFDAEPGLLTGLIGPNGSGKTTLLRALAGVQTIDSGMLAYDGVSSAALGAARLSQKVSYLAQGGAVHWPIRCETLVGLGRLPHRRRFGGFSAADRQAVEDAMRETDTLQFRHRAIDQLSGGERVRVLLARALAVQAPVLLADEPIAALDPAHQIELMTLLRNKTKQKATVVVVLHDLALVSRYCDRVVLMAEGRVIADGTPAAVLSDANLAQAFHIGVRRGAFDGTPFVLPWSVDR